MTAILILAALGAIIATIVAFVAIVPEKKRAELGGFGKFLHDAANFKFLIIEKILQATYLLATTFTILMGFFMLFYVQEGYQGYYYSTPDRWMGGYGLLIMILGPILIRIGFEFIMMAILLVKNVIQINNKLKSSDDSGKGDDVFGAPKSDYQTPVQEPAYPTYQTPVQEPAYPTYQTPVQEPAYPAYQPPVQQPAPYMPGYCPNCGSTLATDGKCPNGCN